MPLSVAQLRTPVKREDALATSLNFLNAFGFTTGSWHEGSKQLAILRLFSGVWADLTHSVKLTVELVFNELATGNGLTEFSRSHYDNEREAAVKTQGKERLTDAASTGPHAIDVGQLVVSVGELTYRNIQAGTIPLAGSVDLTFEAEVAGAGHNVANNTITTLQTPIAGVTVNNPAIGGSTTWITRIGVDEESDATLKSRNRTKWATLSFAVPGEGYVNFALNVAGITRVALDDQNPDGGGSLRIYIANSSGVASSQNITDVQAAVDAKKPTTAKPLVLAATAVSITFAGQIYVRAALNTSAKQTEIKNAILAFINSYPIGTANFGEIPYSEIIGAITAVKGVEKVILTAPTASVGIAAYQVGVTNTAALMSGLTFPSF